MQSKLTLRLDDRLIANAKRLAEARGTSISALVAGYLAALDAPAETQNLTPTVQRLRGVLRGSSASVEEYRSHVEDKHKA